MSAGVRKNSMVYHRGVLDGDIPLYEVVDIDGANDSEQDNKIILKVFLDNTQQKGVEVPITPETTCKDVIDCCKEPGEEQCHLAELWKGCERPISDQERPYEILQQWGIHRDEVKFFLRHEPATPQVERYPGNAGRRNRRQNGVRNNSSSDGGLPSGVDLTLSELQEMASRQQQQIETQQQMLVAKEQRLKFLKQQELKHQQIATENERLRKLREKVEAQELKLKKLRALRGQVDQHKHNNGNLTSELETIKSLFNEKEKELSMAVSKVEDLSKQLEGIRRGQLNGMNGDMSNNSAAVLELEKLRKELMVRNKLNEQQSAKLSSYREKLAKKKDEISVMDKRIEELTDRLRKKKLAQQQMQQQQSNVNAQNKLNKNLNRPMSANVAAVEPYIKHVPKDVTKDDMYSQDLKPFASNRNDPRFQTLPYNTKFPLTDTLKKSNQDQKISEQDKPKDQPLKSDDSKKVDSGKPDPNTVTPTSSHSTISHLGPKPFVSAYSSSMGDGKNISMVRGQPEGLTSSEQNSPNLTDFGSSKDQIFTSTPVTDSNTPANTPGGGTAVVSTANTPTRPTQERMPYPPTTSSAQHLRMQPPAYQPMGTRGPAMYQPPKTSSSWMPPSTSQAPIDSRVPPQYSSNFRPQEPHQSYSNQQRFPPPAARPEQQQIKIDTSPNSVSSALSVLKGADSPSSTGSTPGRPTYRYAPKSVIANTYMKKMGPGALEEYRKNMTQLYKDFYPKKKSDEEAIKQGSAQPGSPTAKVKPLNHSGEHGRPESPRSQPSNQGPAGDSLQGYLGLASPSKFMGHVPRPMRRRLSNEGVDAMIPAKHPPHNYPEAVSTFFDGSSQDQGSKPDEYNYPPYPPKPADDAPPSYPQSSSTQQASQPKPPSSPAGKLKSLLKQKGVNPNTNRRVCFDPHALLLDASLEGELDLVMRTAKQVPNPSLPNDEGITALHNAICAGHYEIVKFLVEYGCDVNSPDSDGWTPLHCAASCNNLPMVKFLVEHGACIFATTISDHETAAEKCEEDEDGYDGCSEYLYSVQEKLGIMNSGAVYGVFDFKANNNDELTFRNTDKLTVLRKGDENEKEWWWAKFKDREGYIPRNLLGLYPRVAPQREFYLDTRNL